VPLAALMTVLQEQAECQERNARQRHEELEKRLMQGLEHLSIRADGAPYVI